MPQVARADVKERASRLRTKGEERRATYLDGLRGTKIEILMESEETGRTPQFAEVAVASAATSGTLRQALLGSHDGRRVNGMLLA
jgi:threonylcarbamoyladenosine tRNA methylthiotransferase MtaB